MERFIDAELLAAGNAAFRLLFAEPEETSGEMRVSGIRLLRRLEGLLGALDGVSGCRVAGCADYINALEREIGSGALREALFSELFDAFVAHRVLPAQFSAAEPDETAAFLLDSAFDLLRLLKAVGRKLPDAERSKVLPTARKMFLDLPESGAERAALGREIAGFDRFSQGRTFRFLDGRFLLAEVESAKPLQKFFGFPGVRSIFRDHFRRFASGATNLPLLIHSLPGYGKTSMTVSYALDHPEVALILPEPEALEGDWHRLMDPLIRRPDRRFVVFFDDIDSRRVDWYNFRTHVGGAFSLPPNVLPVLSSNYEFPVGILSRGRRVSFPVFDEIRCAEMIEDFLLDFGLKSAPRNLVSLIGADYTEEFGQKKFTELSPRTLMRYLGIYEHDRIKRRTMVELAMGAIIQKPDGELFYEFNIELMRSLYGEAYIKRLLKERLRNL